MCILVGNAYDFIVLKAGVLSNKVPFTPVQLSVTAASACSLHKHEKF